MENGVQGVIAEIDKNSSEMLRVELLRYNDYDLCGLRVFIKPTLPGEEPKATRKGLTVRVRQLDEIIAALEEARRRAIEAGMLEDDPDAPIRSTRELYQRARAKELSKGDA